MNINNFKKNKMAIPKPIEKITHNLSVDAILKCLWAIRDNDEFYFNSYGKEMIKNCINQRVKKIQKFKK